MLGLPESLEANYTKMKNETTKRHHLIDVSPWNMIQHYDNNLKHNTFSRFLESINSDENVKILRNE